MLAIVAVTSFAVLVVAVAAVEEPPPEARKPTNKTVYVNQVRICRFVTYGNGDTSYSSIPT